MTDDKKFLIECFASDVRKICDFLVTAAMLEKLMPDIQSSRTTKVAAQNGTFIINFALVAFTRITEA